MTRQIKKLNKRLNKDYKAFLKIMKKETKEKLINQAYNIATINNIYDALDYYIEECDDDFPLENDKIELILSYKGNILTWFQDTWFSCMHPERFDFWYDYYTVIEIIEWTIKERRNENDL